MKSTVVQVSYAFTQSMMMTAHIVCKIFRTWGRRVPFTRRPNAAPAPISMRHTATGLLDRPGWRLSGPNAVVRPCCRYRRRFHTPMAPLGSIVNTVSISQNVSDAFCSGFLPIRGDTAALKTTVDRTLGAHAADATIFSVRRGHRKCVAGFQGTSSRFQRRSIGVPPIQQNRRRFPVAHVRGHR